MSTPLPERVDAARLADSGERLAGSLAAERLPRLLEAALALSGVRAELGFRRDAGGRCLIEGFARARVELVCQRCMEPVACDLEAAFTLCVVGDEAAAAALPEPLEPLVQTRRLTDTAALVEDELLLALPLVARHDGIEDCGPRARHLETDETPARMEKGKTDNPFARLKNLKLN